jgi:hypothetical protein
MFSLYKLAQIIIMVMYTQKRSLRSDDVQHDASATAGTNSNSAQAKSLRPGAFQKTLPFPFLNLLLLLQILNLPFPFLNP